MTGSPDVIDDAVIALRGGRSPAVTGQSPELDRWLGRMYRAHVLTKEPPMMVATAFKAALAEDPDLQAQARARLQSFEGIDEKRCFVTHKHREFLTAALAA